MSWTLCFWCNRADAEALPRLPDMAEYFDDPPSLNAEEPDPAQPDAWLFTAYFNTAPSPEAAALITGFFASATGITIAELADADWTTMSQRGLEPVRAGRFVVHTADHRAAIRPGDWPLQIEAGLAFGTGQHATTHGCLAAIARLSKAYGYSNIADIGTGTGVLAMAASRANRAARAIASDNDPIAIRVAAENLALNHFAAGVCTRRIALAVAAGVHAPILRRRAPYDLVLANILAGPLIALARDLSAVIAPGGHLVMAGLLGSQQRAVANAYRRHGMIPAGALDLASEWPCLVLVRKTR